MRLRRADRVPEGPGRNKAPALLLGSKIACRHASVDRGASPDEVVPVGKVKINGGVPYTNSRPVKLAPGSGTGFMRLSDDGVSW